MKLNGNEKIKLSKNQIAYVPIQNIDSHQGWDEKAVQNKEVFYVIVRWSGAEKKPIDNVLCKQINSGIEPRDVHKNETDLQYVLENSFS